MKSSGDGKTPYKIFCERWKHGCGDESCGRKGTRVVLARGKVPCDVLFVGEAPGESENIVGLPFIGPAGHLLNQIIDQAIPQDVRVAFTNVVGCVPREDDGGKALEPSDDAIRSCSQRLNEFVLLASPRLLVGVGRVAQDVLEPGCTWSLKYDREVPRISIIHPAAVLRANHAVRSMLIQRCLVTIRKAVEGLTCL